MAVPAPGRNYTSTVAASAAQILDCIDDPDTLVHGDTQSFSRNFCSNRHSLFFLL